MKRKKKLDPRIQLAIAAVAPIVVLVAGWLLLVSPQRSKASSIAAQVQTVQQQVALNKAAVAAAGKPQPIRVADVFRLATAMPDSPDMPGIILQLDKIAAESGIQFTSITPANPPVSGPGYQTLKISLSFSGNFYALSDFLYRLRSLVTVRSGTLLASGRLFSVEQLQFSEGKPSFPEIDASLTVDAYVYGSGGPVVPTAPPTTAGTDTTTTTTTSTDTTSTTDTTATTPAASAAGAGGSTG